MTSPTSTSSPAVLQAAFVLLNQGASAAAEAAFRDILAASPARPEALHGLSRALMAQGRSDPALEAARAAVAASPASAPLHYALGIMLDSVGEIDGALAAYTEAVRIQPNFHQAWNNLGLTRQTAGDLPGAMDAFGRAVACRPDYAAAHNNLGSALLDQGRMAEAIDSLRRAVALAPVTAGFQANLGRALLHAGRPEEALGHLGSSLNLEERALGGRTSNHRLYALYGEALARTCAARLPADARDTKDVAGALILLQQVVQFAALTGEADRQADAHRRILALDPGRWWSRLARQRCLPVIPASAAALLESRRQYEAGLDALLAEVDDPAIPRSRPAILEAADGDSFFHLAYQGGDDRPLQEKLSRIWSRLLADVVPDCQLPLPNRPGGERLRIGFAGTHFRMSTVGRYFRSWVTGLDPKIFETRVYLLGQPVQDGLTAEIRSHVDRLVELNGPLDETARAIRAEQLDVLIYPEVGMDSRGYVLAALRLAPIQCAAWGHPVTTGHASIDYYLASEWMEPPDAQDHYTEQLVTLPGLGTCYHPERPAEGLTRSDFGLPEEEVLFFYPHSLFKIHPDCDDPVARILAGTPGSRLVLVTRENPWLVERYRRRLDNSLARHGVPAGRVIELGGVSQARYLALAGLCDLLLDTLHWSGGNTTLDVLTVGLPIVTLPGRFMRGR